MISVRQKILLSSVFATIFLLGSLVLLAPILSPFFIGALLTYLMNPLLKKLLSVSLSRTSATALVFVFTLMLMLLIVGALVPLIHRQVLLGIAALPKVLAWLQHVALPTLQAKLGVSIDLDVDLVKKTLSGHWQQAGNVANVLWQTVAQSGFALLGVMANILLVPVVTFYFMRDWHKVIDGCRGLVPRSVLPTVTRLCKECDEVIGSFFQGQLLVMLALGLIYALGLTLVGLQLGLLIGVIAGLLSLVPYLGFSVGLGLALIASAAQFHDGTHLIWVVAVFAIGQMLEGAILTPFLVGDCIGLHPVAVIFAVMAGGQLFGFLGVLLALPVSAVIMVLLRFAYQHYRQSEIYQ
jgi:predicted PurR-regulated permease PerM